MYRFEAKCNPIRPKDSKLNALQNDYLKFFDVFFDFDPKGKIFNFSIISAYKTQHLGVIQKTGIYVIEIHTGNKHTKIQIYLISIVLGKNIFLEY